MEESHEPARPDETTARERLLRAAERLIARKGFAGVGVQEIAGEAGLTTGAIYSNFSSKSELLMEVAGRVDEHLKLRLKDVDAASFPDFMAESGRQIAAMVDRSPDEALLSFEFALMAVRDPDLRERAFANWQDVATGGGAELAATAERFGTELPLPPEQFHFVVNIVGTGLALYRLMHGEEAVTDEMFAWLYRRLA